MNNLKQFKLATGDEIICEIIEWPAEDDEADVQLIVRNSYKIHSVESPIEGTRYYTFRPWMVYQDSSEYLQIINVNHIVGEANPSPVIVGHYIKAVAAETESEEAVRSRIDSYMNAIKKALSPLTEIVTDSSDPQNVIRFPDRSKLH